MKLNKGCKRTDRLFTAMLSLDIRELIDNAEEITIGRVKFKHEMPVLGYTTWDDLGERPGI